MDVFASKFIDKILSLPVDKLAFSVSEEEYNVCYKKNDIDIFNFCIRYCSYNDSYKLEIFCNKRGFNVSYFLLENEYSAIVDKIKSALLCVTNKIIEELNVGLSQSSSPL